MEGAPGPDFEYKLRDAAGMIYAGSGNVSSDEFQQSSFQRLSDVRFVSVDASGARFEVDGIAFNVLAHATDALRLTFGQLQLPDYGLLQQTVAAGTLTVAPQGEGWCLDSGDITLMNESAPLRFTLSKAGRMVFTPITDPHFRGRTRLPAIGLQQGEARGKQPRRGCASFALNSDTAAYGFGWQRAWQVVKRNADSAELHLKHDPDIDWPFACGATQVARLSANALHLSLAVKNTDKKVMPAGLGFHPFFPLTPDTHLQTDWRGMWQMGSDSLPTALGPVPMEADFSQLRPVTNWKVDHCLPGWTRRAVLDYPTHRMQLDASEACRQIVVFAPNDGRNFIALEPVTNINNAFALAAIGVVDTGVRMLVANESFEISMLITLSGRAAPPAANA